MAVTGISRAAGALGITISTAKAALALVAGRAVPVAVAGAGRIGHIFAGRTGAVAVTLIGGAAGALLRAIGSAKAALTVITGFINIPITLAGITGRTIPVAVAGAGRIGHIFACRAGAVAVTLIGSAAGTLFGAIGSAKAALTLIAILGSIPVAVASGASAVTAGAVVTGTVAIALAVAGTARAGAGAGGAIASLETISAILPHIKAAFTICAGPGAAGTVIAGTVTKTNSPAFGETRALIAASRPIIALGTLGAIWHSPARLTLGAV